MISTKECAKALREAAFHSGVDIMKIYVDKIGPRNKRGFIPSKVRRVSAWVPPCSDAKMRAMAGFVVDCGASDVRITRGKNGFMSHYSFGYHIRCTARLG